MYINFLICFFRKGKGSMCKEKNCFADGGQFCKCLKEKHCMNCSFYRDDSYISKIESDIRLYTSIKKSDLTRKD